MGKRGPKPNLARRRQAKKLREQGLTLSQIAERLGTNPQGAHHLLGRRSPRPICCRQCNAVIVPIGSPGADTMRRRPVCLTCLASMPDAGFGEPIAVTGRPAPVAGITARRTVLAILGLTV
jgi:hypothetical protein